MSYIPKIDELIEAHDDSGGALTCGVEIEFLVPSIPHNAQDPDPDIKDQHVYRSSRDESILIMKDVREQLREYFFESFSSLFGRFQEHQDCVCVILMSEEPFALLKCLRIGLEARLLIPNAIVETLQQQLEEIPFRTMEDDDFYPPHDNVVIYDTWRLGCDPTVSKHGGLGLAEGPYHWTDCELTSAVMGADDYAQEIEDVCRALKTVRIHFNKSTAVHVHVGCGDEAFSLLTLKKFATLFWLTERAILELHHPSRHNNKYSFRLNKCSMLANKSQATLEAEERRSLNGVLNTIEEYVPEVGLSRLRHAQLRRIWACSSMGEVAELMQSARDKVPQSRAASKRGSMGFQRFLPAGKTGGNIQTFEWRQMSGSVDANHIIQWVKACIAFTDFCRLSDKATFKGLMESVIERGKKYTGIELLEALDVDTQIFKGMLEVWSQDPSFCEDNRGRKLFAPK